MNKLNVAGYGLSSNLSVRGDNERNIYFLRGFDANSTQWVHPATRRAAHLLWFSLIHLLFPEKAQKVTSMAATAALSPAEPGMTVHFDGQRDARAGRYVVQGLMDDMIWS